MSLPIPKLDDRDYQSLVEDAYRFIEERQPDWDIRAPSDLGNTLIECFAHMSEVLLYRLNRLPERVYIELLNLLGVQLRAPAAARVELCFSREDTSTQQVIPAHTAVACSSTDDQGKNIIFLTNHEVTLKENETSITVPAYHCSYTDAEVIGTGSGKAGLRLQLQHAPIIAPSAEADEDLIIGVALPSSEPHSERSNERILSHNDRAYRIWREVPDFSDVHDDRYVYMADRQAGTIIFAPALDAGSALAAIPPRGAQIRAWYRSGGGLSGNVAAHTVTQLITPLADVKVTNPKRAIGGNDVERLEHALLRGPQHVQSLRRAVTANDFERLALGSQPSLSRAMAYAKADIWPQAQAGTVSLLLAPRLPQDFNHSRVARQDFEQFCQDEVLDQVAAELLDRKPLGTHIDVRWARCKEITVEANIVCHRDSRPSIVQKEIIERINQLLNPVQSNDHQIAWPFGRTLHASHLYALILGSPGVRYIEGELNFELEFAPERNCTSIAQDHHATQTWYVTSANQLFRSTNSGLGWELIHQLAENEVFHKVEAHPRKAGVLAVHVISEQETDAGLSRRDKILLGTEYGESWSSDDLLNIASEIEDFSWVPSDEIFQLFAASDNGLYDVTINRSPILISVAANNSETNSFYSVCCERDALGRIVVAVTGQHGHGVYLSHDGGRADSFQNIGLKGKNIRCMSFQKRGTRLYLWAGFAALGDETGTGASRIDTDNTSLQWESFAEAWSGGSCTTLRATDQGMLAGSHHSGVLYLRDHQHAQWQATNIGCGLPIRPDGHGLNIIRDTTLIPDNNDQNTSHVLVATDSGLYRCESEQLDVFHRSAGRQQQTQVTLHNDWLFANGEHQISVYVEDSDHRDGP